MFDFSHIDKTDKDGFYEQLLAYVTALVDGERDMIANMANISSLLYHMLDEVNWAGFYMHKEEQLVLGPFHGEPACIRIPLNKGVCGAVATTRKTQLIKDVHEFPGHIACDAKTNSEIVIPIIVDNELIGVLDIDSPAKGRFDEKDQQYLETCVQIIIDATDF